MQKHLCNNCKNYLGDLTCIAFPEGIPEEILTGENDHSEPLEGQDIEIIYEPINNK